MKRFNPLIEVEEDGLAIPEVRHWSIEKYKLLGGYCDIFTTGMKSKWDQLIYIDLFAGAGYAKIKNRNKIYLSSSLIALSVPNPFTKYIFCEKDRELYSALNDRVKRDFSHLNVEVYHGDSNVIISKVLNSIPAFNKNNTLLSFCFVDPFSMNLKFETIKVLGQSLNMDFLILQALHMDGKRNLHAYLNDENDKINSYLGLPNWRNEFLSHPNISFINFLAEKYTERMKGIGYIPENNMHQIRSDIKNLPLYYLSFYSKNKRGLDFYKKVEKYSSYQYGLDL